MSAEEEDGLPMDGDWAKYPVDGEPEPEGRRKITLDAVRKRMGEMAGDAIGKVEGAVDEVLSTDADAFVEAIIQAIPEEARENIAKRMTELAEAMKGDPGEALRETAGRLATFAVGKVVEPEVRKGKAPDPKPEGMADPQNWTEDLQYKGDK